MSSSSADTNEALELARALEIIQRRQADIAMAELQRVELRRRVAAGLQLLAKAETLSRKRRFDENNDIDARRVRRRADAEEPREPPVSTALSRRPFVSLESNLPSDAVDAPEGSLQAAVVDEHRPPKIPGSRRAMRSVAKIAGLEGLLRKDERDMSAHLPPQKKTKFKLSSKEESEPHPSTIGSGC